MTRRNPSIQWNENNPYVAMCSDNNVQERQNFMIRRDFEDGGFPINNRAPVLCITVDGLVLMAYNNYDLKRILETKDLKICKLLGVWPGKKNTDIFILNPTKYGRIAPPAEHKDIDNAETVVIEYGNNKETGISIMYALPGGQLITSKDPALEAYLKSCGRKYLVRYVQQSTTAG